MTELLFERMGNHLSISNPHQCSHHLCKDWAKCIDLKAQAPRGWSNTQGIPEQNTPAGVSPGVTPAERKGLALTVQSMSLG